MKKILSQYQSFSVPLTLEIMNNTALNNVKYSNMHSETKNHKLMY